MITDLQIVAMRGRDSENPSDRTAGNPNLEQRLEPNSQGIANTLTTVQKDNLVLETVFMDAEILEPKHIELNPDAKHQQDLVQYEGGICRCISAGTHGSTPHLLKTLTVEKVVAIDEQNREEKKIKVRQNKKKGFVEVKLGGMVDLNYPTSDTRRGRAIENGQICPTLTTENIPCVLEPWLWEIDGITYLIRIRKLTPKECWRLMDFKDEDFEKAAEVNSNTQLYKQAGNSIVKNVLCEVFKQLIGEQKPCQS